MGSGFFSTDTRATLFDRVTCSESEVNVMQCVRKPFTGEQCSHDAAVICQGIGTYLCMPATSFTELLN